MDATRAAETLRDAILARDFKALEGALAPETDMRALLPGGLREYASRTEIVAAFESWFAGWFEFAPEPRPAVIVGTRVRVGWLARLRGEEGGPPVVIEQTALVDVDEGAVYGIDLLCTGFQEDGPIVPIAASAVVEFDAGTLGCADGLAGEFRRRIAPLEAGQVMRVATRDPAAREDLPPLARLLGHRVLGIEAQPDGRTIISVERGTK
jgi:TusA-related sulfurtransferase